MRRIFLLLILLELLFLGFYAAYRPRGSPMEVSLDWASHWGGAEREYGRAMALRRGYLYLTGSTESFGAGRSDIFLLKYSSEGLLIWNKTWGRESYDMGRAITIAGRHIYVVGLTYEGEESKAVLLKYDEEGRLLWYRVWGPPIGAIARGVVVEGEGAIYVAGYIGSTEAGEIRAFLLKYSQEGELLWSRTWGETGADYCWALALEDGVYLGGTSSPTPDRTEIFLAKFDLDGNALWVRRWGSGIQNYGWALAADGDRIYQVGFTEDALGNADVVLLCYNSDGDLLYASVWDWSWQDYGWAVALAGPYLYIVGHTYRPEPYQWADAFIFKLSRDGHPLWNRTWGGMGWDIARGVVVDGDHIYVTGITYGLGRGGQAFLAGYTSPNRGLTTLVRVAAAASILDALLLALLLASEAVRRL